VDDSSIVLQKLCALLNRLEIDTGVLHPTVATLPSPPSPAEAPILYDPATDKVRLGLAEANELCVTRKAMLEEKAATRPAVTIIHGPPGPVAMRGYGQSSHAKKRRKQREAAAVVGGP
jgi:hypothetical protein